MDKAEILKNLMLQWGYEDFRDSLIKACILSSKYTSDYDDKRLTKQYLNLSMGIFDINDYALEKE